MVRMHGGAHYDATLAKAATGGIPFPVYPSICPYAPTHAHSTSASQNVSPGPAEETPAFSAPPPPRPGTEEPGKLGPLRDASFVPPRLQRMDGSRGGAIYPPVEICGRWGWGGVGGGRTPYHSFSEARDKVLLCLRFCRSVLLQGREKRRRCSR